jgi:hypothetical protein
MILTLLGFLSHLILIAFHWLIGLSAVVSLLMLFKEPLGGLATTVILGILFLITPSGLAANPPEPVTLPQTTYQATPIASYTPTTFDSAPTLSHNPVRNPRLGEGCECPYDVNKAAKQCGLTSSYSRPGGSEPRCYQDD